MLLASVDSPLIWSSKLVWQFSGSACILPQDSTKGRMFVGAHQTMSILPCVSCGYIHGAMIIKFRFTHHGAVWCTWSCMGRRRCSTTYTKIRSSNTRRGGFVFCARRCTMPFVLLVSSDIFISPYSIAPAFGTIYRKSIAATPDAPAAAP
jgi:hypothetical protein